MEDLNKHQLVLLTLLISFVTSIATGIITYTLLQEAPVAVTQTINRVVERTIETVVPSDNGKTVVKEVQVVSEEDSILKSIESSAISIVRIRATALDGSEIVTGIGLVVADGVVVTDSRSFSSQNQSILFSDGKVYAIGKSYTENGLAYLKVNKPVDEKYAFKIAILGKSETLKLGQTIIAIAGKKSNLISISRVSQLEKSDDGSIIKILSDISVAKNQMGSPILNLSGEVVGVEAPTEEGQSNLDYISSSSIKNSLKTAIAELNK